MHYSTNNYTLWTDFKATNSKVANATYLYFVEFIHNKSKTPIQQTITLAVRVPYQPPSATKSVAITGPFDEWLKRNKDKIPWYSPPPKSQQVQSILIDPVETLTELSSLEVDELVGNVDSGVKDIIAGWSVEAIKQAYVEARARHQKKVEPIKVKADFNEFGLLTITFSS